ncbi:hypothetical protein CH282_14805 [Rhodococcus sp. 06-418-1B]|nr:hypothetical protein CH282_14805 [Rhodococcus sp. 06-418-1B]
MTAKMLDHWSAPAGSGSAVAALATTYTFDSQFFTDDCLSRFLALSAVTGEGDKISSTAAIFEEELRLSETTAVSVLIDRGTQADRRNLRWDILPVATGHGLLHAKIVVLVWEHHARIVVGSANLTPAGYRRQLEAALAFDIAEGCQVPRGTLTGIIDELRSYLALLPVEAGASLRRAVGTLDLVTERIDAHAPSSLNGSPVHLAVAPSAPDQSPLGTYESVWRTSKKPLRATVLSPFWDATTSTTAMDAVDALLTGQPKASRSLTAVVGTDLLGAVMAPRELAEQVDRVRALEPVDKEQRTLHAKTLLLENDEWVACLIGSSNATSAGWGLHPTRGHRELNIWIGAARSSPTGRALRNLVKAQGSVDLSSATVVEIDEDSTELPSLPSFFKWCTVDVTSTTASLTLSFDTSHSEPNNWSVYETVGTTTTEQRTWRAQSQPTSIVVDIDRSRVPSFLTATWTEDGEKKTAQWFVNVADPNTLPLPNELADLPAQLLLDALSSTRPIPAAVEHELRKNEARKAAGADPTDALRRFDTSGLLLHRTRTRSVALWGMRERLSTRASSPAVLRSRLFGIIGPVEIARLLTSDKPGVEAESASERHFLLAEIALTLGTVDWTTALQRIDTGVAKSILTEAFSAIEEYQGYLAHDEVGSETIEYAADAFKEARTACGL